MANNNEIKGRAKNGLNRRWFFLLGLILLASVTGVYVFSQNQAQSAAQDTQNKPRTLGTENAPITIVEYADFNCPTCKTWQLQGIKEANSCRVCGESAVRLARFPGDYRSIAKGG